MYESIKHLLKVAEESQKPLHEIIIQDEIESTNTSKNTIITRLRRSFDVMSQSLNRAIKQDPDLPIKVASHQAKKMYSAPLFFGQNMKEAIAWAMSIAEYNSGMGLIVAAPTAGSSGILPAVLLKTKQILHKTDEDALNALFVAAAVGAIIGNRASLSGSECGCQAEVGVASAMAASAIVYLSQGPLIAIDYAISITLKNILGLVCDPVAGLVICPCIKRNAAGVVNAFLSAEMVLSGVTSEIPADEVIDAMKKVGRKIPFELKETGLGGIADTPTAKNIKKSLYHDSLHP